MNLQETLIEKDLLKYFRNISNSQVRDNLLNKCSISKYNKGEILYFDPKEDMAVIFLDGTYHIRQFISEESDYIYPGNGEFWLGLSEIIDEDNYELEVSFAEETTVLSIPLKELLYIEPAKNVDLWIKISKIATKRMVYFQKKSAERLVLPTEVYFLKSLMENNYIFEGVSVQDISYRIHVNTRTLQRIVHNLERDELIVRDKNKKIIKASSIKKVDAYLGKYLV